MIDKKVVSGINHSYITVKNLKKSLSFIKYLGLKKVNEFVLTIDAEGSLKGTTIKAACLHAGDNSLEFIEYQNRTVEKSNDLNSLDVGSQHVVFSVEGVKERKEVI